MKKTTYLNFLHQHLGLSLPLIMFFIALFTFDDYGISWDELTQRRTGQISYDYVFSDDTRLLTWKDKDYGVAFELPLIMLEKVLNTQDSRSILIMRHLATHLFFLVGCFFLFQLIDYLYKNKLLATIGFLFLILHPRIYAHSFYNTKDIPFLSMFIISFYYSVKACDKKSILSFIGLGISVGILMNLRIMGVLMLLGSLTLLIVDSIREKKGQFKLITIFLITSFLTLYITWPFLWPNPLSNFVLAFENMSKFRWGGNVLFNGEFIKATELTWKYIPTWFSITTPVIYVILGISGFILIIIQFLRIPLSFLDNSIKRTNLLFLGYFFAPLVAVIVFKSVLYDGWRQMFFIYPPFILLNIYVLSYLLKKKKIFIVASSLTAITFCLTSSYMIRNFPLQGSYFNELFSFTSPEYLRKNYEMDYWGVSYKQSLEYILKVDSGSSIDISVANSPGNHNVLILPTEERKRINIVPIDRASYFITNYRWHPQDYIEYEKYKFHSLTIEKNTVSEIFKLK